MWTALEIPGMQAAIDLENRQQIMASATADHREAMMAFLEKRPPGVPQRLRRRRWRCWVNSARQLHRRVAGRRVRRRR